MALTSATLEHSPCYHVCAHTALEAFAACLHPTHSLLHLHANAHGHHTACHTIVLWGGALLSPLPLLCICSCSTSLHYTISFTPWITETLGLYGVSPFFCCCSDIFAGLICHLTQHLIVLYVCHVQSSRCTCKCVCIPAEAPHGC